MGLVIIMYLNSVKTAAEIDLTLLHSEWPKLHRVLAVLSAKGLIKQNALLCLDSSEVHLLFKL